MLVVTDKLHLLFGELILSVFLHDAVAHSKILDL